MAKIPDYAQGAKRQYTMHFTLNITYDKSKFEERDVLANSIKLLLAQAIDGEVEVDFVEQQRWLKPLDNNNKTEEKL